MFFLNKVENDYEIILISDEFRLLGLSLVLINIETFQYLWL